MTKKTPIKDKLNDPEFLQSANGWASVFWAANFPFVVAMYVLLPDAWKAMSILYLALVSVYANFVGHISSWQASRVEVKQKAQDVEQDKKLEAQSEHIIKRVDELTPDK